jgi:hypothetical protein
VEARRGGMCCSYVCVYVYVNVCAAVALLLLLPPPTARSVPPLLPPTTCAVYVGVVLMAAGGFTEQAYLGSTDVFARMRTCANVFGRIMCM